MPFIDYKIHVINVLNNETRLIISIYEGEYENIEIEKEIKKVYQRNKILKSQTIILKGIVEREEFIKYLNSELAIEAKRKGDEVIPEEKEKVEGFNLEIV